MRNDSRNINIYQRLRAERHVPSLASSSLTFLFLNVGFLLDSGYTHSCLSFAQRLHTPGALSHLSFRARHVTHASGSVLVFWLVLDRGLTEVMEETVVWFSMADRSFVRRAA